MNRFFVENAESQVKVLCHLHKAEMLGFPTTPRTNGLRCSEKIKQVHQIFASIAHIYDSDTTSEVGQRIARENYQNIEDFSGAAFSILFAVKAELNDRVDNSLYILFAMNEDEDIASLYRASALGLELFH